MAHFYGIQRLGKPEDWQNLAGADKWRPTRSAYELAYAWQGADGIPSEIAQAFTASGQPVLAGLTLDVALVEKPVFLDTKIAPSMTDIMAYARNRTGEEIVVAVEGKATETFGLPVRDWLRGDSRDTSVETPVRPTRARRLRYLADRLGITVESDSDLYYQLLHRTVSAISEAELHGAAAAVLLVHSFAPGDTQNWNAFKVFLQALGAASETKGAVAGPIILRSTKVPLFAMWWESTPRPPHG